MEGKRAVDLCVYCKLHSPQHAKALSSELEHELKAPEVKAHFAGFVQHAPGHWLAYRYSATEDCFFRIDSMDPTVRVARWREVVTELFPFNFFCAAPSQPIHNSITMFTSKEAGLAFHKKLVMIRRSGRYSAPGRQASKLDFDLT